ncbi:MAG: glycosyltransferase family 4 protein [Actinomycetota bacterium]|nr:glycosyltransferase family 4 protein [Actinomycetota bacterium]
MSIVATVHRAACTGGVELSVLHTTRALAGKGHRIHLIYREGGDLLAEYAKFCQSMEQVDNLEVHFPRNPLRRLRELSSVREVTALAAAKQPDVYYMSRSFTAAWALDAVRIWPAPVVCHWRGISLPPARDLRRLARGVTRFIANSRFTLGHWLAAGIDPSRAEVVYNGVSAEEYPEGSEHQQREARRRLGLPAQGYVAVFTGRLDPEKGVEVLIDAWRRADLGADAVLLVVGAPVVTGGDYLDHLRQLAPASVRFLGAQRDVVTPLHASDVAVVPSMWDEPFGRVVIEGLATGRPVVASRVGGIPEILTGRLDRFLFDRGDAAQLADRLEGLRDWRAREPELANICAGRVKESFSLDSMSSGVEGVLQRARAAFGN